VLENERAAPVCRLAVMSRIENSLMVSMVSTVTQSTLEGLGHRFDPHRIFEEVRLRRCRGCGRVWRFKVAHNSFDAITYVWLKLLEPTGWTMTFDLLFEPSFDEVSSLSRPADARLSRRNRKRGVSAGRTGRSGRDQREMSEGRLCLTSFGISSPLPARERIEGEGPITARIFRARFRIPPRLALRWKRCRILNRARSNAR
jgi:hypothetical protein